MALLKSLIQRLLDSRTTPDEAANCAMPEGSKQDITPSIMSESIAWQRMHNGVAVDNGYIQAEGRGATAGKSQLMIGQDPNDFRSFSNTFEATGLNVCFAPVKKGQVYYVYGSNLTNLAIYFFKSVGNSAIVGGGYNLLVWRALSCLRPSFNFSWKVFSRAKRHGFVTSHTAGATLLRSRSLLARLLHTWHHRMASSLLQAPHVQLLTSLFKALTCESTWHALKNKSLLVTSQCQRDNKLTSLFWGITSKATQRDSSQQSVQVSITTGGASC